MKRVVLIPANNEEESLPKVLQAIPKNFIDTIVVVNNNSTDRTAQVAIENGAVVVDEPQMGYGKACLAGIDYIRKNLNPDILIFLDGDYSDYPEDMIKISEKLESGYDMVLGSRTIDGEGLKGLSPVNTFGNRLAGFFLRLLFNENYTDLGPFRAIWFKKLETLNMVDEDFGWTIEMQIKAHRKNYKTTEVPVRYRKRFAGESKVTGSLKGSIKAFLKITYMFIVYFSRIK